MKLDRDSCQAAVLGRQDVFASVEDMAREVMPRPVEVRALEPYRIWLRYDDGVEGEVDLSHLAGQGVFTAWEDPEFFAGVYIGPIGGISWDERVDLCPDAVYMRLIGLNAIRTAVDRGVSSMAG